MPEGSPGTGFDIRRLFSPGTQAREGREDPRTEPHAPVHAAPENPTPITLEDMSACQRTLSALAPESRVLRLLQRLHQTQRRDQACIDRQRPGSRTSTRMAASWMEETTYLCRLAIDTRQV